MWTTWYTVNDVYTGKYIGKAVYNSEATEFISSWVSLIKRNQNVWIFSQNQICLYIKSFTCRSLERVVSEYGKGHLAVSVGIFSCKNVKQLVYFIQTAFWFQLFCMCCLTTLRSRLHLTYLQGYLFITENSRQLKRWHYIL